MTAALPHQDNLLALVVDDDLTMRLLMRESLEQAGFEVEEAENGSQALELFTRVWPDIVLLDVMMPEMDGFGTCAALRQLPGGKRTPVLMTTGLEDVESINRAYEVGATDFITKPINWSILSHRVRYMLRASHAIEELYTSQEALRQARDDMEARVEERTCALSYINALLQQEISERQRVQEALESNGRYFRSLIENASDPITILDGAGMIYYQSPAVKCMLGYQMEDLIGTSAFDLVHPDDLPEVLRVFTEALQNPGAEFPLEFRCRHQNGTWRITEATGTNLLHDDNVAGIVINSRDITERRHAEEELCLRNRAIASTSEGICITDPHQPDNPIIYVNAGFERLSGYTRDEVIGRNCRFLQGPETNPTAVEKLHTAVREERECVVELLNYRKDSTPFWNRLAVTPVRNSAGQVTHFIGVQSDITERKEVERLKDELVSTVSHELRTPLTSLRGFTELMLKRDFSSEKQRQFLTIIHSESLRLTNLINDFLDLQRMESGRQLYTFAPVDLVSLLHDVLAVLTHEDSAHTFRLEASTSFPLVHADADRVRQILVNLLSNAVKFSPEGGAITVGVKHEGAEVVVRVADQGIGIPAEIQSNLFSKFFRVDNTMTRSIGGTGLGLAIVKEIVTAHGGLVWVESKVGVGSTFCFTLPVTETAPVCAEQGTKETHVGTSLSAISSSDDHSGCKLL